MDRYRKNKGVRENKKSLEEKGGGKGENSLDFPKLNAFSITREILFLIFFLFNGLNFHY